MTTQAELKTADLLDAAGELVRQGWCQHTSRDHLYGSREPLYCALGAIEQVANRDYDTKEELVHWLAEAIGIKRRTAVQITVWNDTETRTQKHVVQAFRDAAEMARDSRSKPDRAKTVKQGLVHESGGAGTAIAQEV